LNTEDNETLFKHDGVRQRSSRSANWHYLGSRLAIANGEPKLSQPPEGLVQ
jgi:hypothetical protein